MPDTNADAPLPLLPEDFERVLAVVAHPDDLEYGAASAIARWTAAGKDVVYVLVTRGEAGIAGIDPARAAVIREDEQRASAAVCGVGVVEFLDHRDCSRKGSNPGRGRAPCSSAARRSRATPST